MFWITLVIGPTFVKINYPAYVVLFVLHKSAPVNRINYKHINSQINTILHQSNLPFFLNIMVRLLTLSRKTCVSTTMLSNNMFAEREISPRKCHDRHTNNYIDRNVLMLKRQLGEVSKACLQEREQGEPSEVNWL